ncbi:hypothetical protein F4808DRAFT_463632 [Astrocystis sublimbata]|nr:hypothetical protein F4808DRAFT_463632 [Astrocystis sublimbata]
MKSFGPQALTVLSAVSTAAAGRLPHCSAKSITPCQCPSGTQYSESVTVSIIGADVKDVGAIVNDFFTSDWLGVHPSSTQGPNNKPGKSIRSAMLPTAYGTYNVSELLVQLDVKPDGSFVQRFEQLPCTIPVEYDSHNGSISGYWATIEGTRIFESETLLRWSEYACETGHPQDFAEFHESAMKNVTEVLKSQGKIKGVNVDPVSAQAF